MIRRHCSQCLVAQLVKVKNEVTRYTQQIEQWKQKSQQLRRQKTGELSRRNQQHEVAVQTLQHRIDQLQKEIIQCDRCAKSWEDESKKSQAKNGPTSTGALPGLIIFQRPLPSNHEKRKALLIGVNYVNSHAPLKGCVNDIWNLHCLLRHTLRYSQEQLQILADGFDGRPRPDKMPTKANIMARFASQEVTDCLDIDSQIASAMPSVLIGARGEEEDEEDEEECPPAPPPPPPSLRVLFVDIDHVLNSSPDSRALRLDDVA
eukprot:symbB.v1.2.039568.t1/scaffold6654.1/size18891/2